MNVSEILQSNKVDSSPKMKIDMIRYSWILLRHTHIHAYKQNQAWALSCKGDNADLTWYDVLHGVSNVSFSIDTYIKLHIMLSTKNIEILRQDGYSNNLKKIPLPTPFLHPLHLGLGVGLIHTVLRNLIPSIVPLWPIVKNAYYFLF